MVDLVLSSHLTNKIQDSVFLKLHKNPQGNANAKPDAIHNNDIINYLPKSYRTEHNSFKAKFNQIKV